MKLSDIKDFCKTFYTRFSALDLHPFQLKFYETPELVSIALVNKKERVDCEAVIVVDEDSVFLLRINSYTNIDVYFTFNTPLELYALLLNLFMQCCEASRIKISPAEVLCVLS